MSNQSHEPESTVTPLNIEDLKQEASIIEYVNAAASASSHARNVIIVLIVATVLVAIEIRNTSYSWIDARQEIRAAALEILEENFDPQKGDSVARKDSDLYRRAILFLERRSLGPRMGDKNEHIKKELDTYREAAIQEVTLFHIPFFGAVFDHNDLGMFAGFTFAVLLLWFRYSLARELGNLNLLFNHSDFQMELKRCYELLAMQQILTVPRLPHSPLRHRWRSLPKLLYFIPVPVYTAQMYFDFTSIFGVGQVLGMGKTWLLVMSSILFMFLIFVLSVWCFRILMTIDKTWDNAASRVYPEQFGQKKERIQA